MARQDFTRDFAVTPPPLQPPLHFETGVYFNQTATFLTPHVFDIGAVSNGNFTQILVVIGPGPNSHRTRQVKAWLVLSIGVDLVLCVCCLQLGQVCLCCDYVYNSRVDVRACMSACLCRHGNALCWFTAVLVPPTIRYVCLQY